MSGLLTSEHGGFYASQDADVSLDDDGDYFTWTLDEAEAALSSDELQVAMLHYDIGEVGEMHHNPAKNVLYLRASVEEIAERLKKTPQEVTVAAGLGQKEDVRRAAAAPYAVRRQDGLRGLERACASPLISRRRAC